MKRLLILVACSLIATSAAGQELKRVKGSNGKYGYVNTEGKRVVDCIYDKAYAFSEGLAVVELNGKYGYINTEGKRVVDCIYDKAFAFREGLAVVELNGKWGYINTEGKRVVDCIYDDAFSFREGLAVVELNGKWGYINTEGEFVVNCIYDSANDFNDGFAKVQLNGKWGFINTEGKWFDTIEQGKRWWYMNQPFSKYAKNYVETRINEWQKKGEFEKTIDWKKRVNEQTRNQKIRELTKNAEKQFIS